jgi:hypothetical protein
MASASSFALGNRPITVTVSAFDEGFVATEILISDMASA